MHCTTWLITDVDLPISSLSNNVHCHTATGRWYRGKVVQVCENENKVDVFFVDYGDSEFISCDEILPMPVILRRMPFQAIECSCLDIEPVDLQWNEDVCDVFFDLYYNKHFMAQVSVNHVII